MMQRFWSRLAVDLGKRAGVVTLVGLIVTLGLGFGITQLDFATGQDSYLNSDSQVYEDSTAYQDLFGGQAMITVFHMEDEDATIDELFTEENIATINEVGDEMRADEGVLGVIDPVVALEFSTDLLQSGEGEDPVTKALGSVASQAFNAAAEEAEAAGDAESFEAREEALTETSVQLATAAAGGAELTNNDWTRFLLYEDPANAGTVRKVLRPFFPDDRTAMTITRLQGNQSIEDEGITSDLIVEASEGLDDIEGVEVTTVGAPVLLKDINDYLRGGMLTLGGIALAVMALILIIFFNVRWRLLPLAVVSVGVIWAFGLVGYVGIPLTLVTIAGLPVLLGVGIDYAIQMHSRIEEEVIIDRAAHPIQEAARKLAPPMLIVTGNAVLAFLAILRSETPMIREFGILLAVGIVAICISSIINPLAILGIREYKKPTEGKSWTDGILAHFVNRLGSLPPVLAVVLMVAATAIFVGGVVAEDSLEIQTDPIRWVNQDTDVIRNIETLEEQIGGSSELGTYIVSESGESLFTDETVEYVDTVTQETLEDYPERLLVGSSIIATLSDLTEVEGAEHVSPPADLVEQAWEIAPDDVKLSTASPSGDAMNVLFLTGAGALEDRAPIVDDINARDDAPEGVRVTPSGLAVVGIGLLDNLTSGRILLTYLALALVFVWLLIMMRSFVRSLLAMVPVLIAVGTASLVAYFGGFKLSPMTAVGGPLVVAACTEFTTLILFRYLEERRRGLEPKEAMDGAGARTGRAFVVSALTTMAGVAVIALSSLPLLRDFGITVAINITVALLSALVVLPPVVIWADKRGWVSHGMLDREDEPFIDVPRSQAEAEALEMAMSSRPE